MAIFLLPTTVCMWSRSCRVVILHVVDGCASPDLFCRFDPDPSTRHTVWNVVVGGGMFWCAIYGINQAQVQRAVSVSSVHYARK